jgi:hypothetical protein
MLAAAGVILWVAMQLWKDRPDLQAIFPAMETQTGTITQAYLRVRYGQLPEKQEEIT